MNNEDTNKKERRTDIVLALVAIIAIAIAVFGGYSYYASNKSRGFAYPANVPVVPNTQSVSINDFMNNLSQQNYKVTISSESPIPANINNDLVQLLNSNIYTQAGQIKRIDFINDNKSLVVNGTDLYLLDNTAKTYTKYPAFTQYNDIASRLVQSNYKLSDLNDSVLSGAGFTQVDNTTLQNTNPINVTVGDTTIPVLIKMNMNQATGFADKVNVYSQDGAFNQTSDVTYAILNDQDITNFVTLPVDYKAA